jgi:Enoyl-(Acyl carrier protein) reductase
MNSQSKAREYGSHVAHNLIEASRRRRPRSPPTSEMGHANSTIARRPCHRRLVRHGQGFRLAPFAEGYAVYGAARRIERMADLASAGCGVIALDVSDAGSMVAAVDQIIGEQGRIDVLINNTGYGQFGALEDVPMDKGRRQLDTDRASAPHSALLAAHAGAAIWPHL